jgi:hypothetical protein
MSFNILSLYHFMFLGSKVYRVSEYPDYYLILLEDYLGYADWVSFILPKRVSK